MRFTALSCVAILLAGALVPAAQEQTPGSWHGASLSGTIVSPICSSDAFAAGEASGDFSGSFSISFDCGDDGEISGGTWYLVTTSTNADGVVTELGTLGGVITRGSFEVDGSRSLTTLRGVELEITQATGGYGTVLSGAGTLEAMSDTNAVPQFTGTLRLIY